MSSGIYDLLTDIATRCNVRSEKVLRKTKELIALLSSKQQLSCSDTCKVVVCLELASSLTSSPLSREEAIKYSGCKKKIYTNFYNNISKLLNLDKVYSVSEVCLLVGVTDVKEQAAKLLQKFKTTAKETDFDHPMYPCAAVLSFCRANKIKFNSSKLFEISRVKKIELEELSKKFQALFETKKNAEKTKTKNEKSSVGNNSVKKETNEVPPRKKQNTTGVMTDEEYEEWKRRMLED